MPVAPDLAGGLADILVFQARVIDEMACVQQPTQAGRDEVETDAVVNHLRNRTGHPGHERKAVLDPLDDGERTMVERRRRHDQTTTLPDERECLGMIQIVAKREVNLSEVLP